ncbi:GntP family permease [Actinoallomurus purpureus]|uniref:GntP family permease n=1 Tax=Actinoallomurus purpureus TaxID=478114 RepID=UPI0020926976|nr:SLC13 family permease [Actinoallomurus purpureus]MCO6009880.1 GntP family permease [Actinoallomurus purpureus]
MHTTTHLPDWGLALLALAGIAALLLLVIKIRLHAVLALLIVSVGVAMAAGMPVKDIPDVLAGGFGDTLGSVAIIITLGAMLGRMLEMANGAEVLSRAMIRRFGEDRAPLAMGVTALIFGIPMFVDAAWIVLLPLMFAVTRTSRKPLIAVALPAVGALAMTNAVLPPHPGPVTAAGLLHVSLGWVTVFGIVCGLPAWLLGSYAYGLWIGPRMSEVTVPEDLSIAGEGEPADDGHGSGNGAGGGEAAVAGKRTTAVASRAVENPPSLASVLAVVLLPMVLIMLNTFSTVLLKEGSTAQNVLEFVGDPIIALGITVLGALYIFGVRRGLSGKHLEQAANASLGPIASVTLVIGAGGMFAAVLKKTGVGSALAHLLGNAGVPTLVLAFVLAAALRVALGSKTVAIVTTAPIVAPLAAQSHFGQAQLALVVIAIAAGGTVLSHVNDAGFWLMNRYFRLTIPQTLKSWTVMETLMGVTAFLIALVISLFL